MQKQRTPAISGERHVPYPLGKIESPRRENWDFLVEREEWSMAKKTNQNN